jgi:hypothetical protein
MITSFFSPKTGKKGAGQGSGDSSGPSTTVAGAAATTTANDGDGECSKRARTVTVTPNTGTETDKNISSSSSSTKRIKTSAPIPTAPVFGGPAASAASMGPLSDEVEELLSYMDDAVYGAPSNDEFSSNRMTTWRQALDHHVRKSSFNTLARFVASERYVCAKVYLLVLQDTFL